MVAKESVDKGKTMHLFSRFPHVKTHSLAAGTGILWLSLIVLLPLSTLVVAAFGKGPVSFVSTVCSPNVLRAFGVTLVVSFIVTVVNTIFGVIVAWILERESWPGKNIINLCIDLPFALPTIVVSIVLIALYGTKSPVHITLLGTPVGLIVALAFVTFPFIVRQVQLILGQLDPEMEHAAASLGASNLTIFRRIIFPTLITPIFTGASLAFTRAIGEYGSVILIGGNIPGKTQVISQYIAQLVEIDDSYTAAVVSVTLLFVAFILLSLFKWVITRWGTHD